MKKQKKNISLTLIGNTDKLLKGFSGKGGKRHVKSGVLIKPIEEICIIQKNKRNK